MGAVKAIVAVVQCVSETYVTELGNRRYARSHDCPGSCVLLCQHERHHVDLAQCTVGDNGIIRKPLVLLVIGTVLHRKSIRGMFPMKQDDAPKMLDRGANPAFLKAIDIRGSEDSGQVRVFGEGLKAL